jgi:hypothetical protein
MKSRTNGRVSVLSDTCVALSAIPRVRQGLPGTFTIAVLVTGQSAGAEKTSPAKLTDCHDDGTAATGPDASKTERGDLMSVCRAF